MSDRAERVAREATSREINERLERAHEGAPSDRYLRMVCECGLATCDRVIAITMPEYERVRSDPRWFGCSANTSWRGRGRGARPVRPRREARGDARGGRRAAGPEKLAGAVGATDLELEPVPARAVAPPGGEGLDGYRPQPDSAPASGGCLRPRAARRRGPRRSRRPGACRSRPPPQPGSCRSGRSAHDACCSRRVRSPGAVRRRARGGTGSSAKADRVRQRSDIAGISRSRRCLAPDTDRWLWTCISGFFPVERHPTRARRAQARGGGADAGVRWLHHARPSQATLDDASE